MFIHFLQFIFNGPVMSTAAKGGFAALAAIALQLWLLYDSPEPPRLNMKFNDVYDYIVGK